MKRMIKGIQLNSLEWSATICILASLTFWSVIYFSLLPIDATMPGVMNFLLALALTFSSAFATPALFARVIPSRPAAQYLQEVERWTFGFWFMVVAVTFLIVHAVRVLYVFWAAIVANSPYLAGNNVLWFTAMTTIFFIGVPGLLWSTMTPAQWESRIRQAQAVRKLRLQQTHEIAILRTTLLRSQQLAAQGLANLSYEEHGELDAALRSLFTAQDNTISSIVGTLENVADVTMKLPAFNGEMKQLEITTFRDIAQRLAERRPSAQCAIALDETYVNTSDGGNVVLRQSDAGNDVNVDFLTAVRDRFGGKVWSVKKIATTFECGESTARQEVEKWVRDGIAEGTGMRGQYTFTE